MPVVKRVSKSRFKSTSLREARQIGLETVQLWKQFKSTSLREARLCGVPVPQTRIIYLNPLASGRLDKILKTAV